jgi:ditrans,polycis-polyprenyl diphosphate synthase
MKTPVALAPSSVADADASLLQLPPPLRQESLPRHIAVIMDGNARWAADRGLTAFHGHQAGLEAFKVTVARCNAWRIPALTVRQIEGRDGKGFIKFR